jgi:hypothetical protein
MIAATLLRLIVVALYGAVIARAFDRRLRGAALLATGFLLGCGFLGLELFFLSVLGVAWTRTSVVLGALPVLIVALWRAGVSPAAVGRLARLRFVVGRDARRLRPRRPLSHVLDGVIALPIIGHGFYATWTGLYEWDFFGIWGLKGRTFFDHGGIDWNFVKTSISHPDYPLLVPLLYDLVAIAGGRWDERALGLVFTGMCAAVVMIARTQLGEELDSKTFAAIATLAVVFPALNLWVGLAEGAVMAFGCAGLLFIRRGEMVIGAVLLGFAAWSKNEGVALIGATVVALLVARRFRDVLRMWPAVVIIAPWLITRAVLSLQTDFVDRLVLHRMFARLADPWTTLRVFMDSPPNQPLFWIAVALCLIVYARGAFTRERFLTVALLLQMGLFIAQGIATRAEFKPHVSLTMNRLPQQLAPAFAFLAVVLLAPALFRRASSAPTPSGGSPPPLHPSTGSEVAGSVPTAGPTQAP